VIAVVLVVPGAVILARRFVGAVARGGNGSGDEVLVPALVLYITVIAAMVASALASGTVVGVAGALLFLTSDSLIAEQRFVASRSWQPLAIIVTYHLALAGLVLGQL